MPPPRGKSPQKQPILTGGGAVRKLDGVRHFETGAALISIVAPVSPGESARSLMVPRFAGLSADDGEAEAVEGVALGSLERFVASGVAVVDGDDFTGAFDGELDWIFRSRHEGRRRCRRRSR